MSTLQFDVELPVNCGQVVYVLCCLADRHWSIDSRDHSPNPNSPFWCSDSIDTYQPIGKGTVGVCYDQVEVTVEYSQPLTLAGRSTVATETKLLKEPIIYPNPFKTRSNIQFIASETGKAVVELYNISGAKVRTLFSKNVFKGQVYSVVAGDAHLPKGIYFYMVTNGQQKYSGRIIKLEWSFHPKKVLRDLFPYPI